VWDWEIERDFGVRKTSPAGIPISSQKALSKPGLQTFVMPALQTLRSKSQTRQKKSTPLSNVKTVTFLRGIILFL
jgi:hypothetical protein